MDIVFNLLILVTSIIILVFAYFKKSELGKLIIFILFAAMLLGEFLGVLADIAFLDFLVDFFNQIKSFIVIVEIILIVIVTFFRGKQKPTRILFAAVIILLVVKLVAYFF